ncbi:hypothetical protein JW905_05490 [bacterium]|nr:hypothetical protein [candidate division CSSED10-310 bacterium]
MQLFTRVKTRRTLVVANYSLLGVINLCFYLVTGREMTHVVDAVGLSALALVGVSFYLIHIPSGLWRLTHARSDRLDERELQVTHGVLSRSYTWFTVLSLTIMLSHSLLLELVPGFPIIQTVPLVGSMVYLAHTLPGSFLAWSETELPWSAA